MYLCLYIWREGKILTMGEFQWFIGVSQSYNFSETISKSLNRQSYQSNEIYGEIPK